MITPVSGFSKLSKRQKIDWLINSYLKDNPQDRDILEQYWHPDAKLQQLHEEFTENTISNYFLPLGIAPNFLINGKLFAIPMAIEESSVIAAASKAAKFWGTRGGFKVEVLNTKKVGQVHFLFFGTADKLQSFFVQHKEQLKSSASDITQNMEKRGGGILEMELRDKSHLIPNYYQLHCTFETKDSMGANFINSCLERFAETLKKLSETSPGFEGKEKHPEILMSILSNYVPECIVRAEVSCKIDELSDGNEHLGTEFIQKFLTAIKIAEVEPYRAVTHNKGIMNGIDAVVLATGNDFRAVEAGVHAYASRNGQYSSLTHASVENGRFKFWMEIPLALGTVGGLTNLHPLVKVSLDILQNPGARDLMEIVAAAGLAQNFGAIKSLVTTGIQQGHMKMHLMNILNQNQASAEEKDRLIEYFKTHIVTHSAVEAQLSILRKN